MKKHRTTLKKFIEQLPDKKVVETPSTIPVNFSSLSYLDKYKALGTGYQKTSLYKKDDNVYIYIDSYDVKRTGKSIYIKKTEIGHLYIIGNIVKSNISRSHIIQILKFLGITLFDEKSLNSHFLDYLIKPSFLKSIFVGTIYNEETLIRAIGKRVYHFKNFNWRSLKVLLSRAPWEFNVSLHDIRDFTKSPERSLDRIASLTNLSLISDLIHSAVKLGEVVDLNWSEKRMREEHLRQTRQLMQNELSSKERIPIQTNSINTETITQLNNEYDIFAEGNIMHHCIYTCYFNRIKNKSYLGFHMNSPEDCTFGIRLDGNKEPVLDQIFLQYDKPVQPSTRELANQFISEHLIQLKEMLNPKEDKLCCEAFRLNNTEVLLP